MAVSQHSSPSKTSQIERAIRSLSTILDINPLPSPQITPYALLDDSQITGKISLLLHQTDSGAGDNNLCRWFYDTFQSSVHELQLIVLRFTPIICGLYLTRLQLKKPLAGFEAILLAIYSHEIALRDSKPITLNIGDLLQNAGDKAASAKVGLAVISSPLEPHGMMRSTKRARIVSVALELFYKNIAFMPAESKIEFCEFMRLWTEQNNGRICLPWEVLQPILRILGHCLLGPNIKQEGKQYLVAREACRCMHVRALQEMNPNAILATRSLLRLGNMEVESDYTEIPMSEIVTIISS